MHDDMQRVYEIGLFVQRKIGEKQQLLVTE
jgi:hypothetical protein